MRGMGGGSSLEILIEVPRALSEDERVFLENEKRSTSVNP